MLEEILNKINIVEEQIKNLESKVYKIYDFSTMQGDREEYLFLRGRLKELESSLNLVKINQAKEEEKRLKQILKEFNT